MKVLVIGAGPAGAAISLLLARHGVSVTLVEREKEPGRVFRGEALMPAGVDALLEMGLGDLLEELPFRTLEATEHFVDGRHNLSVAEPVDQLGRRAARLIPSALLYERMIADAARQPGFELVRGATAVGLQLEDGRVKGARLQAHGADRELAADYVIGCDGRESRLRQLAQLPLDELGESYDIAWFDLPAPSTGLDESRMILMSSRRYIASCHRTWDGRLHYAVAIPRGRYAGIRDTNWSDAIAGEAAPSWLRDHVYAVASEIVGPTLVEVNVGRCRRWWSPGLLLLGDAAHPMSPIHPQGINLAFRDAIVAANRLVPLLVRGAEFQTLDAAAASVQIEREPEIARIQRLQHRDSHYFGSWYSPLLIRLIDLGVRSIGRFAVTERAWLHRQRELRHGVGEVKLSL